MTNSEHAIMFGSDGHIIDGNPDVVDREFVYLIEQPTGAIDLVTPSEFRRRYFSD